MTRLAGLDKAYDAGRPILWGMRQGQHDWLRAKQRAVRFLWRAAPTGHTYPRPRSTERPPSRPPSHAPATRTTVSSTERRCACVASPLHFAELSPTGDVVQARKDNQRRRHEPGDKRDPGDFMRPRDGVRRRTRGHQKMTQHQGHCAAAGPADPTRQSYFLEPFASRLTWRRRVSWRSE